MNGLGNLSALPSVSETLRNDRKFDVANWLKELEEMDDREPTDNYRLIDGQNGLEIFA